MSWRKIPKECKPSKEDLERLYIQKEKSFRDIAEIYGIGASTVKRMIRKFGIPARNPGTKRIDILQDAEWLRRQYVDLNLSQSQIAEKIGTTGGRVGHWLKVHGIPCKPASGAARKGFKMSDEQKTKLSEARKGKYIGSDHWNWKGGPRPPSVERRSYAARQWRQGVRERDGWKCQRCNSTERLHAHHIKSWNDYPDLRFDLSNGITLCVVCHQKEHGFPFPSWIYRQGKIPKSA